MLPPFFLSLTPLSRSHATTHKKVQYFRTFTRGSAASRNRTIGRNRVLGRSRTSSIQIERTLVCSLVLNKKTPNVHRYDVRARTQIILQI
jgi:hypothetical protein